MLASVRETAANFIQEKLKMLSDTDQKHTHLP